MPEHKCGTCKHFEGAPMWKKGWCRNPLLYTPQQSHLVGEDDLDCNRGMGSYWEPRESDLPEQEPVSRFAPPPPRTIAPAARPQARASANTERLARPMVAPLPRGRAESATRPAAARPRRQSEREPVVEGYSLPAEHYSWGDYLRRGYPVIGIILLLGAFWVWSSQQLAGHQPATEIVVPTVPANLGQPAAPAVITPTTSPAAPATGSTPAPPPPGVIAPGAKVVVKTPGGAGANIRAEPSIAGAIVTSQDDGAVLTITGQSQDADGYTWWPVQGDGFAGWVAGSLIAPAP